MTVDIPNALVQTKMENNDERVMMKIKGALVDMLVKIEPEVYESVVVEEVHVKVIYIQVLKALYGIL
jgi:hypothetical protein